MLCARPWEACLILNGGGGGADGDGVDGNGEGTGGDEGGETG